MQLSIKIVQIKPYTISANVWSQKYGYCERLLHPKEPLFKLSAENSKSVKVKRQLD